MSTTLSKDTTKTGRIDARVEPELVELVGAAAKTLRVSKSAFISDTLRRESEKVMARADATVMDAATWDRMMNALDTPDSAPRLVEAMSGVPNLSVR